MKNSITKLALLFFGAGSLFAQEKKMITSISVNMNSGSSSSEGVSKNFGLNPNIGANLFWGNIGAGLDVGTFNSNPEFDFAGYAQQNLGTVKRVMIPTDREVSRSTYFLVGPQYAIRKGKMNIILSTKAGITMNKMAEFQIEDEASSKVLASYKAPEDFVRNAFTFKPSLSIGYNLTKSFSLTANAQFVKQTGQQDFTTAYRDLSNVQTSDLKGNPLRQPEITKNIVNAPVISSSTKGASEFMSFGLGLTYTIRATGKHIKDATISMSANKEDNSGTQATEAATKIATGKHFKEATISMSANKEDNSGTQATEAATKIATGKHFKDATLSMSANKEDNSGTQTTEIVPTKKADFEYKPQKVAVKSKDGEIEYSYKPQKDDGIINNESLPSIEMPEIITKVKEKATSGLKDTLKTQVKMANPNGQPNSDVAAANTSDIEYSYKPQKADGTLANSNSENENTSESTKSKQAEAKSNLKANSESVNSNENIPPQPLFAAGIPGIKTKAIKKVGEVPLGKLKSKTSEGQIQLNAIEKTPENLIYKSKNNENLNPLYEGSKYVPKQREALEKNDTFSKKQSAKNGNVKKSKNSVANANNKVKSTRYQSRAKQSEAKLSLK